MSRRGLRTALAGARVINGGPRNGRLEAVQAATNATGFDYAVGLGFALTLA